jgi:iron complex outermembrane receptor protein
MRKFTLLCATSALVMPAMAFAQSTGSIETEEEEIVVTGVRGDIGVEGIVVPDSTKAKGVLTQEIIERQAPGQSILNTVNLIPGVNYTNSDAYGSSGGNLRIRGFDGNRISLTFDGIPLNDTGNYAIFGNQQLDPELIEQVNVNLGTTDVDSPTASAAGGTVNYRTILPERDLAGEVSASWGEDEYHRLFGRLNSGDILGFGLRGWGAASYARNDKFKGPGEIYKQQYNARLYQPLGSGGDFVSLAAHWNKNRNNFYRNPSVGDLRTVFNTATNVKIRPNGAITPENPQVIGGFTGTEEEAFFTDPRLENDAVCANANNTFIGCSNFYEVRINPSNTGNIRGNSRFTLSDNLILTVDPSFQYVLANGGGTFTLFENNPRAKGSSTTAAGVDYNGDGDFLDNVRFYTPNITNTHRVGLTASLIWDITDNHRVRIAYTYDRGKHRQTGEWGFLLSNGTPESVFSGRNATPVLAADGFQLQQRDRKSIALLHQVAGQYIGRFMDDKLRIEVGLRAPFFSRDLETFCPIQAADGFAYCTSEPILARGTVVTPPTGAPNGSIPIFVNQGDTLPTHPAFRPLYAPFASEYKFDQILPNVGATYKVTDDLSVFASYAKGFSAPRTDNLYRAPLVDVDPETTDAFDLGVRYTDRQVQAQATAWMINYQNRIVTSFNPDLGISIDRNVGKVESYGFDFSLAYQPVENITLYGFGSYISAELQEDVEIGTVTSGPNTGDPIFAPTAGKFVAETPEWQLGGRVQLEFGPLEFAAQIKWVDDRFATDINDVIVQDYTTVDLDLRYSFAEMGLEKTYFQLNVVNLFDKFYLGNISTQINVAGNPNFSVGAPRTIIGTLHVGF